MPAGDPIDVLVARIGADLQSLEDHLKHNGEKRCKVRFPRGFLRTAQHFRARYWFIRDANLKRNVAYSLILSDFYRWVLNRTDLWGTPREMIIKEAICLIGAVAESLTKDAMKGCCGTHPGYKKRIAKMVEMGILSPDLQAQLDSLWDWRNNEHLFMLAEWEYGKYALPHYNAAILTLRALRDSLEKWAITQDEP